MINGNNLSHIATAIYLAIGAYFAYSHAWPEFARILIFWPLY